MPGLWRVTLTLPSRGSASGSCHIYSTLNKQQSNDGPHLQTIQVQQLRGVSGLQDQGIYSTETNGMQFLYSMKILRTHQHSTVLSVQFSQDLYPASYNPLQRPILLEMLLLTNHCAKCNYLSHTNRGEKVSFLWLLFRLPTCYGRQSAAATLLG